MKLKLDRLEKVRQRGSRTFARCPACAEMDRDRAGDNLVIFDNGCFACAAFQGDREHACRIEHLAGDEKEKTRSSGPPGAFPPPRQRRKPAPPVLPPDFAETARTARLRASCCLENQMVMADEFGVGVETIRRLALPEGGALGFFPRISIGGTPCLPDRIGYIYPQGIKIRQPWGTESAVRFAWACGRATEPWRYTPASSRPGVRHYYITEGESDLIALADALLSQTKPEDGIALVASPGTAFREEWARLFAGCCVSLVFDNDAAGAAAAARTTALLRPHATQVRNLHFRRS
ncbi:MAG: toprim domain-containing protein [Prosthecobacter sp.]|uniref:toprim domain-containing protein n=1 Tax=Prosthecobacter sp. TaxID=1965333 RepID=UPI00260D2203|nr:toprim domain-containing protein [Prosthecobacter sp.]MCF7788567.1 toprim domain-containing protein [Prosthecobacter sp.]